MKTNIHFESEHKVYIEDIHAGTIVQRDLHDGNGCSYVFSPEHNWESDFNADELRAISNKLDTLNNVDTDEDEGYGWLSWSGGNPPEDPAQRVEVLFRNAGIDRGRADLYDWGKDRKSVV